MNEIPYFLIYYLLANLYIQSPLVNPEFSRPIKVYSGLNFLVYKINRNCNILRKILDKKYITKILTKFSLFYFWYKNLIVQHNLEVTLPLLAVLGYYLHMKLFSSASCDIIIYIFLADIWFRSRLIFSVSKFAGVL